MTVVVTLPRRAAAERASPRVVRVTRDASPRRARESRAGARWTPEEDRELIRLRRSGLTIFALCAAVRIAAEDFRRPIPEVCRRFDWLLGPAAVRAGSLNATERALYALAGRAREDRAAPGGFTLDGHPAEWREVARAANAVLVASTAGPILIPEDGPA